MMFIVVWEVAAKTLKHGIVDRPVLADWRPYCRQVDTATENDRAHVLLAYRVPVDRQQWGRRYISMQYQGFDLNLLGGTILPKVSVPKAVH